MSYRGDNEPEYIDDDEYLDPDENGGGQRRSNVLGGSGSRRADDSYEDPPEDRPASGRSQATRAETRKRAKSQKGSARRKVVKARNPAPSVASSEERRARLAGKKPAPRESESQRRPRPEEAQQHEDNSRRESRLRRLRARFGRADKKTDSTLERDAARLSGLRSGIANLRGRLGGTRDQGESASGRPTRAAARPAQSGSPPSSAADSRSGAGSSARAAQSSRAPKLESSGWLDLDRKLDLIGVALVFGAIVFFFSALSAEQAAISSVNRIIGQALGWGAFAVPVTMFAIGFWLIVRHFGDEAPTVDPIRLSGVALAFLSILVLFQYIESFSYPEAMSQFSACRNPANPACVDALVQQSYLAGRGGGLVGGWIYGALVNSLTELGGFVIMLMVMTFSAMMITRSSMAELTIVAIGAGRNLRTTLSHYAEKRRAARLEARQQLPSGGRESHVRVSKPPAAQLAGAAQDLQALPEPRETTMPVHRRLRTLFGLSDRLAAVAARESLPLAAAAKAEARPNPGVFGRLFSRSSALDADSPPPLAKPKPSAGALERFLNLGDDLPFATEESPVWQRPVRPHDAQPAPAPPIQTNDRPSAAPAAAGRDNFPLEKEDHKPATFSGFANQAAEAAPATSESALREAPDDPVPAQSPEAEADPPDDDGLPLVVAANLKPKAKTAGRAPAEPVADESAAAAASESAAPRKRIDWRLPDHRDLLNSGTAGQLDRDPLERQAQIIEDTLASFGAPGRIVEINSGPVITQYGVEPAYLIAKSGKKNRVKVGAIAKLDKDLQLALGAKSIRVEAPVPGKGYVGIEVPNPDSALVSLRDVMESSSYQTIESPLAIALGVSVNGTPISGDLTQMPHLLIAGATGSGKSICINAVISSLITRNAPDAVKFIMVDPKRVELTGYNGLPHLVAPVVVELERTIGVLRWVTTEMDARYNKFSQAGARNIVDYNSILDPNLSPMPYIVVIIDELADLMMMAPDDTERAITRIAAMARATGIHLVIATQRPSVDVVTGLIKANCPARIAFAVAGSVDSRVILDQPGAERLLGKGDMLYLSGNSPAPLRMQGVHVSNEEINRIIHYWKLQSAGIESLEPIGLRALLPADGAEKPERGDSARAQQGGAQSAFWDMTPATGNAADGVAGKGNSDEDELYQTAVDMVRRLEKASISLLQRRLRIGYGRAARLMDMMEERGVVGPPKEGSSKPRDVFPG